MPRGHGLLRRPVNDRSWRGLTVKTGVNKPQVLADPRRWLSARQAKTPRDKRVRYHGMFEARHLFNYTPKLCLLSISPIVKSGHVGGAHSVPRNYPRHPRLLVVNASAAGRSSKGEPI
jgi:hypothetical protein